MIIIKNTDFVAAVESHGESQNRIAGKSEGSREVLTKLLKGNGDFNLSAAHKIADYLGFDINIEFVKRVPGGNDAAN